MEQCGRVFAEKVSKRQTKSTELMSELLAFDSSRFEGVLKTGRLGKIPQALPFQGECDFRTSVVH